MVALELDVGFNAYPRLEKRRVIMYDRAKAACVASRDAAAFVGALRGADAVPYGVTSSTLCVFGNAVNVSAGESVLPATLARVCHPFSRRPLLRRLTTRFLPILHLVLSFWRPSFLLCVFAWPCGGISLAGVAADSTPGGSGDGPQHLLGLGIPVGVRGYRLRYCTRAHCRCGFPFGKLHCGERADVGQWLCQGASRRSMVASRRCLRNFGALVLSPRSSFGYPIL